MGFGLSILALILYTIEIYYQIYNTKHTLHPIKEFILLQKATAKVVLLTIDLMLKDVLSEFEISPKFAGQKSIDDFLEIFSSEAEQAGLHPEFVAEQASSIPERYRILETTNTGIRSRGENGVFTPFGLVDHLALIRYNGFNLFDLLDDNIGHTTLEINGENFYFVLMRNMPIADLSEEKKLGFEYRLAVWSKDGSLVGFRDHYVEPAKSPNLKPMIKGYDKPIEVHFWGNSNQLGFDFKKPSSDGIWVNPDYRRRRIGYTLENVASGFIPTQVLGISGVVVYPGSSESQQFYWKVGYEGAWDWVMIAHNDFPKIMMLPGQHARGGFEKQALNEHYSPTWQYSRLLSLEKRTV